MFTNQDLLNKWKPLLESEAAPKIEDTYKASVTARLLENQEFSQRQSREALNEDTPTNTVGSGQISKYDPVMISLVRRAMPKLIAYDICGVQPMTGPTGLIFAMRAKYANGTPGAVVNGDEAFYNEAKTGWSGNGTNGGASVLDGVTGGGMATSVAELLGSDAGDPFKEMGFEIEKVTVEAKSRALKAQYSVELSQDLKQIHGLDAETELAAILSSEILAEINREVFVPLSRSPSLVLLT